MPELPEVETIRKGLDKVLPGKKIREVKVLREKSFGGDSEEMRGWIVESVGRKAKVLEMYFKGQEKMLIIHLKMTGQLVFVDREKRVAGGHPSLDWVKDLPSSHSRVVLRFDDGSELFFNDMRVFGWIRMVDKEKYLSETEKQPPDVTSENFTSDYLKGVLSKTKRAVKLVLVDQSKIGGVGNIYCNDALYLARIRPDRPADSLSKKEVVELWKALIEVIERGIKYGGSSAADEKFVDISGEKGEYQKHFLVYERAGEKCKRDKGVIKKIKMGGRGTYYCPECQE